MQSSNPFLNLLGFRPTGDLAGLTCFFSKQHKAVWFLKQPPLKPPTTRQRHQVQRFATAAQAWKALPQPVQTRWNRAAEKACLYLHGYNLWIYWQLTRDRPTIETVERQTNLDLLNY